MKLFVTDAIHYGNRLLGEDHNFARSFASNPQAAYPLVHDPQSLNDVGVLVWTDPNPTTTMPYYTVGVHPSQERYRINWLSEVYDPPEYPTGFVVFPKAPPPSPLRPPRRLSFD